MNYAAAFAEWSEDERPEVIAETGPDDRIALSESWNDYTDELCKAGDFTALQYHYCPAFDDPIPEDDAAQRRYILEAMGFSLHVHRVQQRRDNIWTGSVEDRHFRVDVLRGSAVVHEGYFSQGPAWDVDPSLEDVVYSLLMDASNAERGGNLIDWLEEIEMQGDFRRSERIYNAQLKTLAALQKHLSAEELEDLHTLFQDF